MITPGNTVSSMLAADPIAASTGANNTYYEPQRNNNFHLLIPNLKMGMESGDVMSFSLESFDFPKDSNDPIELPFGNESRKVAGKSMVQELSISLKDFCDAGTAEHCRVWRSQVYNPLTGAVGWAANYKCECTLTLFGPNESAERIFTLVGVWPMDVNYGSGDMNGGDYNRIDMTLAIDKVIPGTSANMSLLDKGHNNISTTPTDWAPSALSKVVNTNAPSSSQA